MNACAARDHLARCAPAHRRGVEALLKWHSEGGPWANRRERTPVTPDAGLERLLAQVHEALRRTVANDLPPALLQPLPASALIWRRARRRPASDDDAVLGSAAFWSALGDDVEWIDIACSVHRGGRWLLLHPDLGAGRLDAAGHWRTPLTLDADALQTLAELGLSARDLAPALVSSTRWVAVRAGLGAFVDAAVDCGWPASASA